MSSIAQENQADLQELKSEMRDVRGETQYLYKQLEYVKDSIVNDKKGYELEIRILSGKLRLMEEATRADRNDIKCPYEKVDEINKDKE